ncbi:hypothetical protein F383_31822 [Gossypium arboreum]|uniref:Uncharacterized protein n=1 Tax=Gossypium arboreum TaxID=29729 RepID=A0A0B0MYR5_GOSAR|nr:hypothetical protein F383_31822 [Gossypium arboreum]
MVRLAYFFHTSLLSYIAYSVLFSMFYSMIGVRITLSNCYFGYR